MPRLLRSSLLLLLCLLPLGQVAFAQRPPGYVDNVEEQMAQMQAKVRYGSFLEDLGVSAAHRAEIDSAITCAANSRQS